MQFFSSPKYTSKMSLIIEKREFLGEKVTDRVPETECVISQVVCMVLFSECIKPQVVYMVSFSECIKPHLVYMVSFS